MREITEMKKGFITFLRGLGGVNYRSPWGNMMLGGGLHLHDLRLEIVMIKVPTFPSEYYILKSDTIC